MVFSASFLAQAGAHREALAALPDLEETLERLWQAGHQAWPGIAIAPEAFLAHLAARLPAAGDPAAALAATHAGDLFLACACTLGAPEAIAAFERAFIPQVSTYLGRGDVLPRVADDVKQSLRAELLVADGGLLPRISVYTGRGPLGAWLRVAATRTALRLHEAAQRREVVESQDPALYMAAPDPELSYLKEHTREDFKLAFEGALGTLQAREGAILRLFYLEGMTVAAIGALYRVSGRTVQRWVAETRHKILDETQRRLAARLRLSPEELKNVLDLVRSRMDVSIWKYLGQEKQP